MLKIFFIKKAFKKAGQKIVKKLYFIKDLKPIHL